MVEPDPQPHVLTHSFPPTPTEFVERLHLKFWLTSR